MGSSKKHKKHKLERREKYEEYSHNTDPSNLQRGLKLILKVGPNNTPEYGSNDAFTSTVAGPPTAVEAMHSSPLRLDDVEEYREKHKKSKKKKKKKDREKKHKHHKEKKRDKGERHVIDESPRRDASSMERTEDLTLVANQDSQSLPGTSSFQIQRSPKLGSTGPPSNVMTPTIGDGGCDSSQDGFSFMDDENSQPLPEHVLLYAGITTENSLSCRPISKPIVPIKTEEIALDSPASSSVQSSSMAAAPLKAMVDCLDAPAQPIPVGGISPTKPLSELIIPSPSHSTSASTPGGSNSMTALTPKALECPKTPSSTTSESGREPRTCVLKLKQQKTSLNKLLEQLLRGLEKRDPHHFFAWPVTDDIAPGYSKLISRPMDFSTMRQKIDDNEYGTLTEFTEDFRLMCDNAIRYNHVETVYHKAAKRLRQVGMKHIAPDSLMRSLKPMSAYMRDLTAKELGFELLPHSGGEYGGYDHHGMADSADEGASTGTEEPLTQAQIEEEEKRKAIRLENQPKTRFEPYVDDLTSEEILAQVQGAAEAAKKRLSTKEKAHKMGFLRQNKDGSTSLGFLIKDENEGPEKVVSLGELVGKLKTGSGQVQGYREDKRNEAKLVKPLNYGPFSSFAPTFDSRFSTLNKDETQLVMETYGDAMSTEYAESILQFTKDSSYATMLANGLLDIITNGEHSKCMQDLYDLQQQNYEQQEALKCFNNAGPMLVDSTSAAPCESRAQIEQEYEKYKNTRIDFNRLRTLNDLGIDCSFLNDVEKEMKNFELTRRLQEHLSNNLNLIDKLRNTQHDRLSQPLPQHLGLVQPPSQEENQLANQVAQHLTDVVKKLPPSAVTDPYALRKAMGLSFVGLPPPTEPQQRIHVPPLLQQPVTLPSLNFTQTHPSTSTAAAAAAAATAQHDPHNIPTTLSMDIDEDVTGAAGGDLENELREFLESGPGLHAASSSNVDDNNLVAQLLMN